MKTFYERSKARITDMIHDNSVGVAKATTSLLSTRFFLFGCQFVSSVILARMLQPVGRGQYAILILLPNTIYVLGNLGLGLSVGHYAAKNPSSGPALNANSIASSFFLAILYSAGLLLLFQTGLMSRIGDFFELKHMVLLTLAVFLLFFINYSQSLFMGFNYVTARNVTSILEATVFILMILTLAFTGKLNVFSAFTAWVFTTSLNGAVSAFILIRLKLFSLNTDMKLLGRCLKMGVTGVFGTIAGFIILQSDLYLIQYFKGNEATGVYSVAASLSFMILSIPQSIGMALFPDISRIEYAEGLDGTDKTMLYSRMTFIIMLLITLTAIALAPFMLEMFYGPGFKNAVYPFGVLAVAVALGGSAFVMGAQLHARGLVWIATVCSLAAAGINIVLNLFLIQRFSILGAALSSLVSYGLYAILLSYFYCSAVKRPMSELIPGPQDLSCLYRFARGVLARS